MTLRPLSPRRRAALPAEAAFREQLFERANWTCEFCRDEPCEQQHEIARGSHRQNARTCFYASLALGTKCHAVLHRMAGDDAVMLGLAILQRNRPADYSLSEYHRLTQRCWPSQSEVDQWSRRIAA